MRKRLVMTCHLCFFQMWNSSTGIFFFQAMSLVTRLIHFSRQKNERHNPFFEQRVALLCLFSQFSFVCPLSTCCNATNAHQCALLQHRVNCSGTVTAELSYLVHCSVATKTCLLCWYLSTKTVMNFIGVRAVQWQSKKRTRKERKKKYTGYSYQSMCMLILFWERNINNSNIKGNRSKNCVFHFG